VRLETEPFLEAGPSLIYRLKDLFRAIAKLVNQTADATDRYAPLIVAAAPPGMIQMYANATAPTGWLKCNGAAVSRTTYAALFAVIGTGYGAGDGSTTFNLPELRGEFLRAWDDSRGVDSGRALGSTQAAANAAHTHGINDPGHSHSIDQSTYTGGGNQTAVGSNPVAFPGNASTNVAATGISTQSQGSEARPRNVAFLVCIKT
jgi:microcystin-dependent protein